MPASPEPVRVHTIELARSISGIADLCHPILAEHHDLTAYITARLATAIGAAPREVETWTVAAALHDVGALSLGERLAALDMPFAFEDDYHAEPGAHLVGTFPPFAEAGAIIRYHHRWWDGGEGRFTSEGPVALGSFVVAFADRVAVLSVGDTPKADLHGVTMSYLEEHRGTQFPPDLINAFATVADESAFWYDLESIRAGGAAAEGLWHPLPPGTAIEITDEYAELLARMTARLIDFKSRFTASHSAGVSAVASALAESLGMSGGDCDRLHLAGFLHDAGKMAVPTEILEKAGPLDENEWRVVRTHPYLTFKLLATMPCWKDLTFASLHHQHPDGSGYPFHLDRSQVPPEAAVMAVADVATALTEDRPYRSGMGKEAIPTIRKMAEAGALAPEATEAFVEHFGEIDEARATAQAEAVADFEAFTEAYRPPTEDE